MQLVKKSVLTPAILLACILCANEVAGHGTPINAYVHSATGQLAVFDGYEPGELESTEGSDIFTDAPGIGVSSPVNGIASGEPLRLNVVQGLLYWDGSEVASTVETLFIDWPDDGGTSPVEFYDVTAESGYQTGMLWGNYQPAGGTSGWDAHGDYALESAIPQPGIYGVVLQLDSPSYIASEPFLVPLIYDPLASFGASEVAAGIAKLEAAIIPLPSADFDRNTEVDARDFEVWLAAYSTDIASQVQGDASGDGLVAGDDFLIWQTKLSSHGGLAAGIDLRSVPEPGCTALAACIVLSASAKRKRGS